MPPSASEDKPYVQANASEHVMFPLNFEPTYTEPIEARIWDEEQRQNDEWWDRNLWREAKKTHAKKDTLDPQIAAFLGYTEEGA